MAFLQRHETYIYVEHEFEYDYVNTSDFSSKKIFKSIEKNTIEILNSSEKLGLGQIIDKKVYFSEKGQYLVQSLTDYRESIHSKKVIFDFKDLGFGPSATFEYLNCKKPQMVHCLVYYQMEGKRVFVKEVRLDNKKVEQAFHLQIPGNNRAIIIDDNHLLIGVPNLDDMSSTTNGVSRQVRIWKRGQDFKKSKVILTIAKDEIGLYPWDIYNGKDHNIVISRWFGDGISGETYVLQSLKLKKLDHALRMNSFHSFYKNRMILQLKQSWKKFKKGEIIAISVDGKAPELVMGLDKTKSIGLNDIVNTRDRLLVTYTLNVQGEVAQIQRKGKNKWKLKKIPLSPNASHRIRSVDYFSNIATFVSESYLQPKTASLNYSSKKTIKLRSAPALFNSETHELEQNFAISKDGTKVPYFIVKPKEMAGPLPTILYGYGAFNYSLLPSYNATIGKDWLEKGGVYVSANVRGGGEFGLDWYDGGRGINKQNSIDDFIAVARDLLVKKITTNKQLGIEGRSAGGLLVTAAMVQRPDLFGAVVGNVPVTDLFSLAEYKEEYGNPEDPEQRAVMLTYSPYQNISEDVLYPPTFLLTSRNDFMLHPLHARKLAARMNQVGAEIYFHERVEGGHTARTLFQEAAVMTFFRDKLNF